MNSNNFLMLLFFFTSFCNAQMFDLFKDNKINVNHEYTVEDYVNKLYDNFEVKIKNLVLWELEQIKRIQKEIKFETKDLPENRHEALSLEKIAELEMLITSKEIDLDFWYLEELDKVNKFSESRNKALVLRPETKVKGRILKIIIENLAVDTKVTNIDDEMFKIKNEYQLEIESASFALTAGSKILPALQSINIIFQFSETSVNYAEDLIFKLKNNYSKYFSLGMITNARETHLEQIKN